MTHQKQNKDLESRLYTLYRISIYAFGLVMALGILSGTWFGLHMVQKHDAKHQLSQGLNDNLHKRIKPVLIQPFQKSESVHFSLPYQHGANAKTLTYIAQLEQKKTKTVSGGFQLVGVYQANLIEHEINLQLSCAQGLCHLEFDLPSRLVLQPRLEGSRLVYPKRNFNLWVDNKQFTVQNSRLISLGLRDKEKQADFQEPQNLDRFYQENYLNQQGEKLTWKP